MTPTEIVLMLIKEMHEWETWANQNDKSFDEIESDDFDEDKFEEECDRRYYSILDKYAIDRSVCKGISYGKPTDYDANEKIISSEIDGETAIVRTKQTHRRFIPEVDSEGYDPNSEVIFKLKKTDQGWRICERKKVDPNDGEVFDVGI